MSRHSVAPLRHLTLTEELERLEQSITLTLQEIDSNFSKAHRIVTSSILPIVEQYAHHSQNVWEGSKFWKQFFEASANVSLSGYEEPALEEDATYTASLEQDSSYATPEAQSHTSETSQVEDESSILIDSPSNATGVLGTPRLNLSGTPRSPPPSEPSASKLPVRSRRPAEDEEPSTPRPRGARSHDFNSSPFDPPSAYQASTTRKRNNDPLLHRVLDKTYRVAATPHRNQSPAKPSAQPAATTSRPSVYDSSPMSSPAMALPTLRSEMFRGPRTPGSAAPQTRTTSTGREITFPSARQQQINASNLRTPALWDSDSDDDVPEPTRTRAFDLSPGKGFVPPQGRLVATPAREASRRIVADLLASAGGGDGWSDDESGFEAPPSPTVVRGMEDDTF